MVLSVKPRVEPITTRSVLCSTPQLARFVSYCPIGQSQMSRMTKLKSSNPDSNLIPGQSKVQGADWGVWDVNLAVARLYLKYMLFYLINRFHLLLLALLKEPRKPNRFGPVCSVFSGLLGLLFSLLFWEWAFSCFSVSDCVRSAGCVM